MSHHTPSPRITDGSRPTGIERLSVPFVRISRHAASSGIILLVCTVAALAWANSPWAGRYHTIWYGTELSFGLGPATLAMPLITWINDALMAVFFFLVGLEIKRELLIGELSTFRKAAFPIIAAVGGMAVPGLLYALVQSQNGSTDTMRGWGIPTATDIAFALGVLALLGSRVPTGLRIFLATLAIADDLGALVVIAVFYTESLNMPALGMAAICLGFMIALNILGVRRPWAYLLGGVPLWYFVHASGIHATIAGVLGAMAIPVRARVDVATFLGFSRACVESLDRTVSTTQGTIVTNLHQQSLVRSLESACEGVQTPLQRLEFQIHPWVVFLVVPVFALANAGVELKGSLRDLLVSPVSVGVALGLTLGKPIGITIASWLAARTGIGVLPTGVSWRQIHAASWLGGIGFTMSLFIANLAFGGGHGESLPASPGLDQAKIGVLIGSAVAGVIGLTLLAIWTRRPAGR